MIAKKIRILSIILNLLILLAYLLIFFGILILIVFYKENNNYKYLCLIPFSIGLIFLMFLDIIKIRFRK